MTRHVALAPPARPRPGGLVPRAVRLGARLALAGGLFRHSPDPDRLLARAARLPGAHALTEWEVAPALHRWAAAMRDEADLSPFGRVAAHYDAARLLATLARLGQAEEAAPAIRDEAIAAPLFILGMPRSGTTFLHGLLAADPANQVPLCWHGVSPYPPATGPDRRRAAVARQVAFFNRLAPDLAALHPLSVDVPQECGELVAPCFRSLRFDTTHHLPGYRRWLDEVGHDLSYRFHRRFLQHLQAQGGGGRWVLKCPDHAFALPAIRRVYPDARFLFVHRDPLKVLPSVARLTEVLREPFANAPDALDIGRTVADDWHLGAELMQAAARTLPASAVHHLHFAQLRDAPLAAVAETYARFGWRLSPTAEAGIAAELRARPRGGYGRNRYRFADHGLDPQAMRERFRSYTDAFAVPLEVAT